METYRDFAMEAGFLGLTYAEQGEALGCGKGYAGDLWNGRKPLTAPIEAKLRQLIEAKANGPVGFTPTDPNPPVIIDDISRQHPRFVRVGLEVHCEVVVRTDLIATFASEGAAEEYAEWRNEERD